VKVEDDWRVDRIQRLAAA